MSPLRSSAGPAVCTNGTSSSAATICASEVLPRPGGPASSRWSSASPRALHASIATASCPRSASWPTNSSQPPRPQRAVELVLRDQVRGLDACGRLGHGLSARPRQTQRVRDQLLGAVALGIRAAAARPLPARSRARAGLRGRAPAGSAPRRGATTIGARAGPISASTPTFSRSSTMIRSAVRLPIPGTAWKRAASPAASAPISSRGGPPESTASATFGPTDWTASSIRNRSRSCSAVEAVQRERVVAHDQVGVQRHLLAGRGHVAERLGGTASAVADAAAEDHDVVAAADRDLAAQQRDHRPPPSSASDNGAQLTWQIATASASAA